MGTGALAGRPSGLVNTEIAFGRLENRQAIGFFNHRLASRVMNRHHLDTAVGTAVGARAATDAGLFIDRNDSGTAFAGDCARRATDHADRVLAMHAGTGKHPVVKDDSLADKTGVAIVRRRAGSDTIIAAGASIQVNHHCLRSVHQAVLNDTLKQLGFRQRLTLGQPALGAVFFLCGCHRRQWRRQLFGVQPRQDQLLHDFDRDSEDVHIADCPQTQLPGTLFSSLPIVNQFPQPEDLPLAQVFDGLLSLAMQPSHADKATANQDEVIDVLALLDNHRFLLDSGSNICFCRLAKGRCPEVFTIRLKVCLSRDLLNFAGA
jgi:hypothetical protein